MKLFDLLKLMLLNVQAETVLPDDGQLEPGPEGQPEESPVLEQVDETPPPPAYAEAFGADATLDDAFAKYQELSASLENMKGKTTRTEQSLHALRQAAERTGMKTVYDDAGNAFFLPSQEKKGREPLFTDDHRKQLNQFFTAEGMSPEELNASTDRYMNVMSALIQDKIDGFFYDREQKQQQEKQAQQQFQSARDAAWDKAVTLYPSLNSKGEGFDKNFYALTEQIWAEKYSDNPTGDLLAAIDAANQLGVGQRQQMQDKRQAFDRGRQSKTVVAPSVSAPVKSAGKLSYDEYRALSKEDQEAYDRKQLSI